MGKGALCPGYRKLQSLEMKNQKIKIGEIGQSDDVINPVLPKN